MRTRSHRSVSTLIIVALAFAAFACASMGTHKSILNKSALDSLTTIGIGPYDFNKDATEAFDSVFTALDTTLVANLRASGRFQRIVPWDTLKLSIDQNAGPIEPQLFQRAKEEHLGAILICRLALIRGTYMFIPLPYDAFVTLYLFDVESKSLIATIQFDTMHGKSYFLSPGVGGVTKDATIGAVEALVGSARSKP
jgi:hypothetical protein